jgi:hypothetical protein
MRYKMAEKAWKACSAQEAYRNMECQRTKRDKREEEEILCNQRPGLQDLGVVIDLLDARPCQVYVEEQEEDSKTQNRAIEAVVGAPEAVE